MYGYRHDNGLSCPSPLQSFPSGSRSHRQRQVQGRGKSRWAQFLGECCWTGEALVSWGRLCAGHHMTGHLIHPYHSLWCGHACHSHFGWRDWGSENLKLWTLIVELISDAVIFPLHVLYPSLLCSCHSPADPTPQAWVPSWGMDCHLGPLKGNRKIHWK
jgi:hypothetical protein